MLVLQANRPVRLATPARPPRGRHRTEFLMSSRDKSGNATFRHERAAVIAVAAVEAPEVVTSDWIDEQLTETYERCGVRPGLLTERAAGCGGGPGLLPGGAGTRERRWWPAETRFDEAAAMAGRKAIEVSGVD